MGISKNTEEWEIYEWLDTIHLPIYSNQACIYENHQSGSAMKGELGIGTGIKLFVYVVAC